MQNFHFYDSSTPGTAKLESLGNRQSVWNTKILKKKPRWSNTCARDTHGWMPLGPSFLTNGLPLIFFPWLENIFLSTKGFFFKFFWKGAQVGNGCQKA